MTPKKRKEDNKGLVMSFIDNVKGVYSLVVLLSAMGLWVFTTAHADYMTLTQHAEFEHKKEIKDMVNEIADLNIDLQEPQTESEARRINKKLIRKKAQLNNMRAQ